MLEPITLPTETLGANAEIGHVGGSPRLGIFVAFVAYCLMVTLKHRLRALAPGLTPRVVLEKLSAMQMVDVHLPTTDGRRIVLPRYTQPEQHQRLLLQTLKLKLPPQPSPRIITDQPKTSAAAGRL